MYKKRSEIFDANFVYFLLITAFVMIRIISSTFAITDIWGYILNIVIQIGLMFCLPIFLFSALRKQKVEKTVEAYKFNKVNFKSVIYSIIIGVLVYGLTVCISSFFSVVLQLLGYDPNFGASGSTITEFPLWLLLVELFFTAVLPGICEEVAHRGMLLHTYKKMGVKKAILLSGLLFGLMHLNVEQFFYATFSGFLFGFIAITSDSIVPTMIMHFVNNAISVFMSYSLVNNNALGQAYKNLFASLQTANPFVAFMGIFIVVMIMVFLLFVFITLLMKESQKGKIKKVADEVVKQQMREKLFEGTNLENSAQPQGDITIKKRTEFGSRVILDIACKGYVWNKGYKPTLKENIFMYSTLFLGIVLTIFTFVWGVI